MYSVTIKNDPPHYSMSHISVSSLAPSIHPIQVLTPTSLRCCHHCRCLLKEFICPPSWRPHSIRRPPLSPSPWPAPSAPPPPTLPAPSDSPRWLLAPWPAPSASPARPPA